MHYKNWVKASSLQGWPVKRVISGCEPGDIVTVIDEILLWIFLQHQESFPFHVPLKENSFQTNQKLITWHLWFILLNPPSLLSIALPCVHSKADLQGGSPKLGTEECHGQRLHLQRRTEPSESRKAAHQRRAAWGLVNCSLWGCPLDGSLWGRWWAGRRRDGDERRRTVKVSSALQVNLETDRWPCFVIKLPSD